MRKLILLVVAFLLLAAPAFAQSAAVVVNISGLDTFAVTGAALYTITGAELTAATAFRNYGTDGTGATGAGNDIQCAITRNTSWAVKATVAWGVSQSWTMEARENATTPWFACDGNATIVSGSAGASFVENIDTQINGLAWGNVTDNSAVLTFTIS